MKKTTILPLFVLISFFANGQTSKSSWLVGGGAAFTSTTEKESGVPGSVKTTIFVLTPNAGYFFLDNLAGGLSVNLTSTHTVNGDSYGGTSTTVTYFTAGPFVRYYFNTAPKVKIFVHGDASWGSEKYSYTSGGNTQSQPLQASVYDGKAGVAVFLNPTVAVEFTAGYQSTALSEKSGGITSKSTDGSVIVGIGFQIYLAKK